MGFQHGSNLVPRIPIWVVKWGCWGGDRGGGYSIFIKSQENDVEWLKNELFLERKKKSHFYPEISAIFHKKFPSH